MEETSRTSIDMGLESLRSVLCGIGQLGDD